MRSKRDVFAVVRVAGRVLLGNCSVLTFGVILTVGALFRIKVVHFVFMRSDVGADSFAFRNVLLPVIEYQKSERMTSGFFQYFYIF